ncbi:MAG TPA: hypothetical protein VFJ16_29165 [Longimicrobium sp.]|nr:hypothetical protein [Longimicrobium sp.]
MEHPTTTTVAAPPRGWITGLCNCSGRRAPRRPRCSCLSIDNVPVHTPDLAIYSQEEVLAGGGTPSWDSPDIITNDWGPFRLKPEATVKIRNLSPDTPAINALVNYYVAPFGIGTRRQLAVSRKVNVPAAAEITLTFPLDQATLKGDPRVGVFIEIEHPKDDNVLNNRGGQVHDGAYTSEAGRKHSIQIPVLNDSNFTREIKLGVFPTDVLATVTPSTHVFAPHEQIVATLHLEVPGFLSGTPASPIERGVTVAGRLAGGELVGGVTRLLRIDN